MPEALQQQGSNAPLPPIPKMDAAQTAKTARDAARSVQGKAPVAVGQTTAGTEQPVPAFKVNNNDIPPEVVPMLGIIFGSITVMVLGYPIIRLLTGFVDRRNRAVESGARNVEPQLRQLQDSIDAMAIEIERISEGQRFTSRLLSERADARALEAPKQG